MSIAANYYLSSPVEVGREEELRAVRSQAAANLAKFKQEYEGVRKGLVQAEEQKRKRREEQRC